MYWSHSVTGDLHDSPDKIGHFICNATQCNAIKHIVMQCNATQPRAGHGENKTIFSAWFDHLEKSFSYIRSLDQIVLPAFENQLTSCWKLTPTQCNATLPCILQTISSFLFIHLFIYLFIFFNKNFFSVLFINQTCILWWGSQKRTGIHTL